MIKKCLTLVVAALCLTMVLSGCVLTEHKTSTEQGHDDAQTALEYLRQNQDKIVLCDGDGNTLAETDSQENLDAFSRAIADSVDNNQAGTNNWTLASLPEDAKVQYEYRLYPSAERHADRYISLYVYEDNASQLQFDLFGFGLTFSVPESLVTALKTPESFGLA